MSGKRPAGSFGRRPSAAHAVIRAGAVYSEIVRVGALAIHGELAGFAARGGRHYRAWNQANQSQEAGSIEWQMVHFVAAHDGFD